MISVSICENRDKVVRNWNQLETSCGLATAGSDAGDAEDARAAIASTRSRMRGCGATPAVCGALQLSRLRYNTPLYGWVEKRFGLSRAEFVVIYSLALMDGVTASEIAASTAFPKNTLSRAVNRIAKLGLIRAQAATTDRRQQNLTLTPQRAAPCSTRRCRDSSRSKPRCSRR